MAGSSGRSRGSLPSPYLLRTAPTVESGIPSDSAISGLVKRNSRRHTIACSRLLGVRPGTRCGADERSSSPLTPSALNRSTHFQAVRLLTPAASAAAASDQRSTNTRSASSRLERGHVLAFLCNVITDLLGVAG